MPNIETDKMLRLDHRYEAQRDNGDREQQLCHATIILPDDLKLEVVGKFTEFGDFIGYVVCYPDDGTMTFYIKTNAEFNHSAEAKKCVIIECKGFFFDKKYIKDIRYGVMRYQSSEEADEAIYDNSALIGTMLKEEGYRYNASHQRFDRICRL